MPYFLYYGADREVSVPDPSFPSNRVHDGHAPVQRLPHMPDWPRPEPCSPSLPAAGRSSSSQYLCGRSVCSVFPPVCFHGGFRHASGACGMAACGSSVVGTHLAFSFCYDVTYAGSFLLRPLILLSFYSGSVCLRGFLCCPGRHRKLLWISPMGLGAQPIDQIYVFQEI